MVSEAYRCDICGKLYLGYPWMNYSLEPTGRGGDVCRECCEEVREFLKKLTKEKREVGDE